LNITDVVVDAPEANPNITRDRLWLMLQRQWELERKYRPMEAGKGFFQQFPMPADDFPVDLSNEYAQIMIKDAMERIIEELMEAANTLKNKPWKNTHVDTDEMHFFEELADAWHFFLRLWLITCGTPDDAVRMIYSLYFKKSEVNKFRQNTNY
jgi:hypothetical protein